MRPSLLLAPLAAFAIAAVAWWQWRETDSTMRAAIGAEGARTPARANVDATQAGNKAPPREEVERAQSVARDRDARTKGLCLRVQLRGVRPDAPWTAPAKLMIWGADKQLDEDFGFEDTCRPDADARFVFELPDWCEPEADGYAIQGVWLSSTDSNYEPLHCRYWSLDPSRELVIEVDFVSVLTGNVLDTTGKPVAWSRVVAFASRNGQPLPGVVATAPTEPDGSYRLLVPPGAPMLLVALPCRRSEVGGSHGIRETRWSMTGDLLPAAKIATAVAGAPTIVPDFVLERAAHVTGIVQWDDGTPIAYVWLEASPRGGDTLPLTDGEYLRRIDARLAPGTSFATDQQGRFALPTLPGITIDVRVLRGPRPQDACPWIGSLPQQAASDAKAVVFTMPRPVVLRARCGVEPSEYAQVDVADECVLQTDKSGELTVVPTSPVRVRAMQRDMRSPWYDIGPVNTGRTIDLSLRTEKLTAVTIEITAASKASTILYRRDDGLEHSTLVSQEEALQLFLDPGRYHVAVASGPTALRAIEAEVDVLVGDEPTSVRLQCAPGGTLTVKATDGKGAWVGGTCAVHDTEGREWRGSFQVENQATALRGADQSRGRPGELLATGVNTFRRLLPPGDYELRCDFGEHGTHRETVTIRADKTTEVRIRLP